MWQKVKCGTVAKSRTVEVWQRAKFRSVAKGKVWDCGKGQSVGLRQRVKCGTVAKDKVWDCGKRQSVGLWQSIKCGTVTKGKMWDCGKRQSVGLWQRVKCGTVCGTCCLGTEYWNGCHFPSANPTPPLFRCCLPSWSRNWSVPSWHTCDQEKVLELQYLTTTQGQLRTNCTFKILLHQLQTNHNCNNAGSQLWTQLSRANTTMSKQSIFKNTGVFLSSVCVCLCFLLALCACEPLCVSVILRACVFCHVLHEDVCKKKNCIFCKLVYYWFV